VNLNDRFPIAEDDTTGYFSCTTCGAIVDGRDNAIRHNDWHDSLHDVLVRIAKILGVNYDG